MEYAFDGLVGPTHQYAGLSSGNLASLSHAGETGNPRAAALQGLAKMRLVAGLGAGQAVLPPHERPYLPFLRSLGFAGDERTLLERVAREAPALLRTASSASAMWTANAATVTPCSDTADGRTHFTPANLVAMLHRSLEVATTTRLLRRIFADERKFVVHEPLPGHPAFGDEGAANHSRLETSLGALHLFGWGQGEDASARPARFPARQSRAASEAVQRRHGISRATSIFAQQDPEGIDAGAFHSDVLAVGSGAFFLLHERAFLELPALLESLRQRLGDELELRVVTSTELALPDAVRCYPFNSELVPLPAGGFTLLAPSESQQHAAVRELLDSLPAQSRWLCDVRYVDVNDSMRNGGGPACLRLRVPLGDAERAQIKARVFFDAELDARLATWIERHYRDRLAAADLADYQLLLETRTALDELTQLLELGSVYEFQR